MRIPLAILYSQFDPRWANMLLGFNTVLPYDFFNYACLLCCLTEVAYYYGHFIDPIQLNQFLKENDGYKENTGIYKFGGLSRVFPEIIERIVLTPERLTDEQMAEIRDALDHGYPVIVKLDYNPKTIAREDHFVFLTDYDETNENNFTIADSLGGRVHSLRDFLGGVRPDARNTITQYMIYTGPVVRPQDVVTVPPVDPAAPIPNPTSALPANYAEIIHKATQFDEVVKAYPTGKPAEQTNFGEVNQVITRKIEEAKGATVIPSTPLEPVAPVPVMSNESEFRKLVEYLEIEKPFEDVVFEDMKRVVAGLKASQKDFFNKYLEIKKNAEADTVKVKNLSEENGTLRRRMTQEDKIHRAEILSLKQLFPSFDKLKTQYEGVLTEARTDLDKAMTQLHELRIEHSNLNIEQQETAPDQAVTQVTVMKQKPSNPLLAVLHRILTIKL